MTEEASRSRSNKLERVVWEPKYSVHVEELDAQHRELFSIINRLADVYEKGSDDVYPILEDLVLYASNHFHAEGLVMSKYLYPELNRHNQYHDHFIEKVRSFLRDYRTEEDEDLTYHILTFCRNWLYFHVLEEDMKYAKHLADQMRE
jgi:hemerythrin